MKGTNPNNADTPSRLFGLGVLKVGSDGRLACAFPLTCNSNGVRVEEVRLGTIMAHVVVRVGENQIESVITRSSAEELSLTKGFRIPNSVFSLSTRLVDRLGFDVRARSTSLFVVRVNIVNLHHDTGFRNNRAKW